LNEKLNEYVLKILNLEENIRNNHKNSIQDKNNEELEKKMKRALKENTNIISENIKLKSEYEKTKNLLQEMVKKYFKYFKVSIHKKQAKILEKKTKQVDELRNQISSWIKDGIITDIKFQNNSPILSNLKVDNLSVENNENFINLKDITNKN
jgi:hypothetical protein